MSASRQRRTERRDRRTHVRALARPRLPAILMQVWEEARSVLMDFLNIFQTPAELALREYAHIEAHTQMRDWILHLELLVRRLIFTAAGLVNIVLRPLKLRDPSLPKRVRKRRRILLWPNRPRDWPARFFMRTRKQRDPAPRRAPAQKTGWVSPLLPTFTLARRLEALRRVIANPEARIRRYAIHLARLAEANARANAPRTFALRAWKLYPRRPSMGQRVIMEGMRIVQPLAEAFAKTWDATAWNDGAVPD